MATSKADEKRRAGGNDAFVFLEHAKHAAGHR